MSDSTLRTGVHRIELVVRDHELDQYGVVNNAVYPQYLEVARADLLHQIGVDTNAVAAEGRSLALAELSLRFLSPLRGKMRFVVETQTFSLDGGAGGVSAMCVCSAVADGDSRGGGDGCISRCTWTAGAHGEMGARGPSVLLGIRSGAAFVLVSFVRRCGALPRAPQGV